MYKPAQRQQVRRLRTGIQLIKGNVMRGTGAKRLRGWAVAAAMLVGLAACGGGGGGSGSSSASNGGGTAPASVWVSNNGRVWVTP